MKKCFLMVTVLLFLLIVTAGCGKKTNETDYEKIHNRLLEMETFEADASVKYISNKTSHSYETKQQCRITGEYRIEVTGPENVAGNTTVSDGKVICQFNNRIAGKIFIVQKTGYCI